MPPEPNQHLPLLARDAASTRFHMVRSATVAWCASLEPEDTVAQSMPDTSPAKWHLAHTTWFFETFLLTPFARGYRQFHAGFEVLFNSYYRTVGPLPARARRGLLTRPTLREVLDYRVHVDAAMLQLLDERGDDHEVLARLELGLNHEQQHQELLLTDIRHLFAQNPLEPAFRTASMTSPRAALPLVFVEGRAGIVEVGDAGVGFTFDNEAPRHRVLLQPHALANRCVTNAEFRAFIDAGGYREHALWLSDGWDVVTREGWAHPLYWDDAAETEFSLLGRRPLEPAAPVCNISFFEADAFARWAQARLPTEFEWEAMAQGRASDGNFADSGTLRPLPAQRGRQPDQALQLFGDVWEWTASPYVGYPGYRPATGALGEYNGKFMNGQWVLRGGSCATPCGHMRASYRNFFSPAARWQFSGLRLARDA